MDLEKSILDTIIYFDIFDYPLSFSELYQWLFQTKTDLENLKDILEQNEFLKNKIEKKENFYFLKGRGEIIKIRKEREEIAQKKIKKAKKVCKWLLFFNPFVKGIAICNDLGYFNAPEESDIDFFIITQKNRIWMARFFLILPLKLFGLRPTLKNKKDKICIHFFITENSFNLEKILLKEKEGLPDIHFIYWLTQFLPLYGEDDLWQKFYQANNWLKNFLPNFTPHQFFGRKIGGGRKFLRILHSYFIDGFSEKFYRWFQLKILPKDLKEKMNKGDDVIINNQMLKFHNPDKREFYRQKFISNFELRNGVIVRARREHNPLFKRKI